MSNFLPKGYGTPDFWDKETAQYYENHNREEEIKNFMKKLGYGDYSDKNGSTFPQIGSETDILKNQPLQPQQETPQAPITAPNNEEITTANFAPFPISNNQLSEQPSQTERPSVTEQVSQDNVDLLKENANKYLNQINSGNYGLIQQIAANKNSYENDQTAAMLQSQGYNVTGDNIRQKVHDDTEYLRKFANAENIDLGAWGSAEGISNADSQFAMDRYNYEQAKTAKEKFENVQKQLREDYAQSSQQRFEELYDYYRSQHKSQRDSIILAGRETMAYAKERTGFLQNAIDEYGIDDGAILNQFGVSVLGQLATEDNIMGTAYAQAMQKARENNKAAYDRLIQNLAGQMERAQYVQGQTNLRKNADIQSAEKIAAGNNTTSRQNTVDRINSDIDKFNVSEKHKFELENLKFEHDKFLKGMTVDNKNNKSAEKLTDNPDYKFAKENVDQTYKDYSLLLGKSDNVDEKLIEEARQKYEDAKNQLRETQKELLRANSKSNIEVTPAKDIAPEKLVGYGKYLVESGMKEQGIRAWLAESGITGADQRRYIEKIFGDR